MLCHDPGLRNPMEVMAVDPMINAMINPCSITFRIIRFTRFP